MRKLPAHSLKIAALEKSHKNEKRLNTKCQELGSEIASQQARVDAAKGKTREDQVLFLLKILNDFISSNFIKMSNGTLRFHKLNFHSLGYH